MSWDVVFWRKENAVDFVPSIWANTDKSRYKYPTIPSDSKRRQMIYDCTDITNSNQYIWYDAECKKANIIDINLAKDLCERGQFTSTFETDNEENIEKRQRDENVTTVEIKSSKRRPQISSSEEDSTDENDKAVGSMTNKVKKRKKAFTKPIINIMTNTQLQTPTLGRQQNLDESQKLQTPGSNSSSGLTSSNLISGQDFSLYSNNNLGSLLSVKFELTEINSRLEIIENLLRVRNSVGASETFTSHNFCITHLPAKTVDELDALNTEIIDHPEHLHELQNFLYLLGGENINKTIYLIMGKIFHKDLAVLYSGQGRKKKLDFSRMKLYQVVMDATRQRHTHATNEDMKKVIGLYLASAKARLKN